MLSLKCAILMFSIVFLSVSAEFSTKFWGEELTPRLKVNYLSQSNDQVQSFLGNQTHKDHFKLLQTDGVSLLIGARNVVYNLSLADLTENYDQRITWNSMDRDRELCIVKGKSEDECQNYIRVLAQTDTSSLLVCGTNSFKPKCRTYTTIRETPQIDEKNNKNSTTQSKAGGADGSKNQTQKVQATTMQPLLIDDGVLRLKHEFSGTGICPLDPSHNSTAIFTGGELYSGTVSDFSGTDALIYRNPLRTEQYDLKHLNSPDFVSSTEDEDYVYFFFREAAVEYINCGKAIYSRVARVCKKDHGGSFKFAHRWTTFLKARLNCSVPGDFPFYFNEIQGATKFVNTPDGNDKMVYATFTTPDNAIAGSAICSYRLSEIRKAFDEGDFKGQKASDYNWLPVRDVPSPRPGLCNGKSKELSESHLNFIKGHSLMDTIVQPAGKQPIFVKTSLHERLTAVSVDPGVKTPGDDNADQYDVLYVGTTKGKVFKIVSSHSVFGKYPKPVISEEIQVFPYHVAVKNLQVVNDKLIVVSDHEVKSMPLHRCSAVQVQSCSACVQLKDPHCAWNVVSSSCVDKTLFSNYDASELLQDIYHGRHPACSEKAVISTALPTESNIVENRLKLDYISAAPTEEIDVIVSISNDLDYPVVDSRTSSETIYTGSSMITASVVTALMCLAIGFLAGFFTSRRCSRDDYKSCGHHYLEHHLSKTNESTTSLRHDSVGNGYTTTPCNNLSNQINMQGNQIDHSKNNLLVNLPTKNEIEKNNVINSSSSAHSGSGSSSAGSNNSTATTATTVIHNGTLPRNATGTLCKKVYL